MNPLSVYSEDTAATRVRIEPKRMESSATLYRGDAVTPQAYVPARFSADGGFEESSPLSGARSKVIDDKGVPVVAPSKVPALPTRPNPIEDTEKVSQIKAVTERLDQHKAAEKKRDETSKTRKSEAKIRGFEVNEDIAKEKVATQDNVKPSVQEKSVEKVKQEAEEKSEKKTKKTAEPSNVARSSPEAVKQVKETQPYKRGE